MTRNTIIGAVLIAALGAVPMFAHGRGQGQGQVQGEGPRGGGEFGQGPGRGPGGRGGPGGPGGPNVMAMVRQLDLTDAQREQVRALVDEERQQGGPGAAVREAEQKLQAAIFGDKQDAAAIEAARSALTSAHAAELDRRVVTMEKLAQILTPAQRQQLLKLEPPAGRRGR